MKLSCLPEPDSPDIIEIIEKTALEAIRKDPKRTVKRVALNRLEFQKFHEESQKGRHPVIKIDGKTINVPVGRMWL